MKTPEQYKEDFLKRASIGFLLKHWRLRFTNPDNTNNDVRIEDVIWSRESGKREVHVWTESEFRSILEQREHWKRKHQGKQKRKLLAKKYKHGRSKM